jgi:hypothetical protein
MWTRLRLRFRLGFHDKRLSMAIPRVGSSSDRWLYRDLDSSHHPGHVVKEKIEAVALENAFLNGKMAALSVGGVLLSIGPILTFHRASVICLEMR